MDTNYTNTQAITPYQEYKLFQKYKRLQRELASEIKEQNKYLDTSTALLATSTLLGIASAVTPSELSLNLATVATSLNVVIVSTLLACEYSLYRIKKQVKTLEQQL